MQFNMEALGKGIELMLFGMAGIFAALFLLYLVSAALLRMFPGKNK